MGELAEYRSHKVVRAGKIVSFDKNQATSRWDVGVIDADGVTTIVDCPSDIFARGFPPPDSWLLLYRDGYKSWSPGSEFEDGYDRLPAQDAAA